MLIEFLFELRKRKLPVSTHEWMALMQAMALGLHESSLDGFYHLCRTICVKDIAHYDAYDEAFLAYFKDIHTDALVLTEQIRAWLADPRNLEGGLEELDLEETIDKTGRNAGDIDIVFRPPRRNRVKVVLLMDVGGSMDPHAELVSRLFTAASRAGRFAKFRSYYFHNCVYNSVYDDAQFRKAVPVADLLPNSDRDEKLVIVGDALMHPAELLDPCGSMYPYSHTLASGI